jgi:hypothetical protein
MIGLRDLERGIDPERWSSEFGLEDDSLATAIAAGQEQGWLEVNGPCRLTPAGLLVADRVAELLLNA